MRDVGAAPAEGDPHRRAACPVQARVRPEAAGSSTASFQWPNSQSDDVWKSEVGGWELFQSRA